MNGTFLIIGGTFKSGTSSLFTYLNQVEAINGSSIKETGFFVPARYDLEVPSTGKFMEYFSQKNEPDAIYMEASPGYLYGGKKIAESIKERLGEDIRMVFLLRDPAERFLSFYKMLKNQNVSGVPTVVSDKNMSAEAYYEACLNYNGKPDEKQDYIYHGLKDGNYVDYLHEWYECLSEDRIKIVFFDELTHSPETTVRDILNWLSLDSEVAGNLSYRAVNRFREHKNSSLQKLAMTVNSRFEKFWRRNERLKQRLVRLYERINTPKTKSDQDQKVIADKLHHYYTPKNKELKEFLQQKGYSNLPNWLN